MCTVSHQGRHVQVLSVSHQALQVYVYGVASGSSCSLTLSQPCLYAILRCQQIENTHYRECFIVWNLYLQVLSVNNLIHIQYIKSSAQVSNSKHWVRSISKCKTMHKVSYVCQLSNINTTLSWITKTKFTTIHVNLKFIFCCGSSVVSSSSGMLLIQWKQYVYTIHLNMFHMYKYVYIRPF